jgi:hypothetical protein
MRIASPFDCLKALIAGFGPMKVASRLLPKSAVTASGPALKVLTSRVTFAPSA